MSVTAHDAANAPTAGSAGSSFLATSAITSPSPQVGCYQSLPPQPLLLAYLKSNYYSHFEEMCIYFSYISADSDLLHSPFEDIHVVEVESNDQQGINNELKLGSVYVN